jgi:hypothetical protein
MDEPDTSVVSILETVATADRTDPVSLPALSDAIDPAALNALLDTDDQVDAPFRVTFDYAGYEVTVDRDGCVTAIPGTASDVDRAADSGVPRPSSARTDGSLAE